VDVGVVEEMGDVCETFGCESISDIADGGCEIQGVEFDAGIRGDVGGWGAGDGEYAGPRDVEEIDQEGDLEL
jgi:hypothetical protein